jgi:UDP-N-acetylmuramoylalanine--D-glutamate ligase
LPSSGDLPTGSKRSAQAPAFTSSTIPPRIQGSVTLIAGGADKGLDLGALVEAMNTRVANLLLLQGTGTQRLLEQGLKRSYTLFDNLEDAVVHGVEVSTPGATLLLSPGFASFGMFKNEFDRGDRFRELVRSYTGEKN